VRAFVRVEFTVPAVIFLRDGVPVHTGVRGTEMIDVAGDTYGPKEMRGEDHHADVSFFLAVFFSEFYFVVHDPFIMDSHQNSMAQWSI
jgi:hypothetical protein